MLHNSFLRWENKTTKNTTKTEAVDISPNRNASSLMQEIVLHSSKYRKDVLPDAFSYDELTGEIVKRDIIPSLIPYTSDKADIFEELQRESESCKELSWKQMPLCEKVRKLTSYLYENDKRDDIVLLRGNPSVYISHVTYDVNTKTIQKINYERVYKSLIPSSSTTSC